MSEHEATASRCRNHIEDDSGRWSTKCGRDANPDKDGLCNICYAARKRGIAAGVKAQERYDAKWAKRNAIKVERDRKLAAHDVMLAALKAVEHIVYQRVVDLVPTSYQNGEQTEESRNRHAEIRALWEQVKTAIAAGEGAK